MVIGNYDDSLADALRALEAEKLKEANQDSERTTPPTVVRTPESAIVIEDEVIVDRILNTFTVQDINYNALHVGNFDTAADVAAWDVLSNNTLVVPRKAHSSRFSDLQSLSLHSMHVITNSFTSSIPDRTTWVIPDYFSQAVRLSTPYIRNYYIVQNGIVDVQVPPAELGTPPYTYSLSGFPGNALTISQNDAIIIVEGSQSLPIGSHTGTFTVTDSIGDTASLDFTIEIAASTGTTDTITIKNKLANAIPATGSSRTFSARLTFMTEQSDSITNLTFSAFAGTSNSPITSRSFNASNIVSNTFHRVSLVNFTLPANRSLSFQILVSGPKTQRDLWIDQIFVNEGNTILPPRRRAFAGRGLVA